MTILDKIDRLLIGENLPGNIPDPKGMAGKDIASYSEKEAKQLEKKYSKNSKYAKAVKHPTKKGEYAIYMGTDKYGKKMHIQEGKMKSLELAIKTTAYKAVKGKSKEDAYMALDKMWISFSKDDKETWNKLTGKEKKNLAHFFNQMKDAASK